MARARSRRSIATAVLSAVLLAGCGSSGGDTGGTTTPTPAISITLSSSTLSVVQGQAGNVTVNLTRSGGFTGDVALAVTGLPTGVTVSSATITAASTSATLSFAVAATAAPGNASIAINASGSGVSTVSATLALTVTAVPVTGSYTLTANPSAPSFAQGGSSTVVITITRGGGFAGAVALSVTGAANGLTAALTSASTTGTTDTLTLSASATATVGAQTLTVKGSVTGLTDQNVSVQPSITALTSSGNVTWQFCGTLGIPVWVAFQDGTGGTWTHVSGTNDSYTFNITQSVGGVAYVKPSGTGFDLEVFYGSKADLQGRANEVCGGAAGAGKTVTAPVAGTSVGDVVLASLGPASGSLATSTITFSNVPNGNVDLIAGRTTLTINQVGVSFNLAKMIIRRNLNPAAGSALATIDFGAAEAFTPVTKNLTINNLGTDVSAVLGLYFTSNSTVANYFTDFSGGGSSRTYPGVPSANQAAGDLHILAIVGLPSLTGSTPQREALFAFHTAADQTFALGPVLNTPTVSTLAATGYARVRAAITVQPEYNKDFSFNGSQTGAAPRSFTIQQTAGYSSASSLNLDVPDLSAVSGFDVNWGPKVGTAVGWTFSSIGFPGSVGITQPPFTEGASYMFASRPGTITP
jgi:hypothetical protein